MASEQESIFKSASTDALKKAASLLGIAAQLYRDNREQEYFERTLSDTPWEPEEVQSLQEQTSWLENCKKENGFDDDYLDQVVASWSAGKHKTIRNLPSYTFNKFVNYLKEAQRAANASK